MAVCRYDRHIFCQVVVSRGVVEARETYVSPLSRCMLTDAGGSAARRAHTQYV